MYMRGKHASTSSVFYTASFIFALGREEGPFFWESNDREPLLRGLGVRVWV